MQKMPPVEENFTEGSPTSHEIHSEVQIHALRYKINTGTNEACFYIDNVDETSGTISKSNQRFLWQSQKWNVYLFDVAKLPIERRKKKIKLREIRRRQRSSDEGKDFNVTEIVTFDENDRDMSLNLREYIWKPKNVNINESYVLVVYVDDGENPDEILGKPSSHSMNTTAVDFELSFDDFLDSLNETTEEQPEGGLAKLTFVSEKLLHVRQETETESENEEFYEIEPINVKLLYEQPITWVSPYEGKYGLSTSHFQLSERFGDSLESKLLKVTTRGGYLSDFSLSFSEVKQLKKSRPSNSPGQPNYSDIPKDTIVIDKLDKLNETDNEGNNDGVLTNKCSSPLTFSDDEGFEEISLPVPEQEKNLSIQIQQYENPATKNTKPKLKDIVIPKSETDVDSFYGSGSPKEDTSTNVSSTPIIDDTRYAPITKTNKSKTDVNSDNFDGELQTLRNINIKNGNIIMKPDEETVFEKPRVIQNDNVSENNDKEQVDIQPLVFSSTVAVIENAPVKENKRVFGTRPELSDSEIEREIIPSVTLCKPCNNIIDEIDEMYQGVKQNSFKEEIVEEETVLPAPKNISVINDDSTNHEIDETKTLSPVFIEVHHVDFQQEMRENISRDLNTIIEEEDVISPVDVPSEFSAIDLSLLEKEDEVNKPSLNVVVEIEDQISETNPTSKFSFPDKINFDASLDQDSNKENEKDMFATFDEEIRNNSPGIRDIFPSEDIPLSKHLYEKPIFDTTDENNKSVVSLSHPIFLKTVERHTGYHIENDRIAVPSHDKEIIEEPVLGVKHSRDINISLENLTENEISVAKQEEIEDYKEFENLNEELTMKNYSVNNLFYCSADDENVIERPSPFFNKRRSSDHESDDDNVLFVIKPLTLDSVVVPTKINQEESANTSYEDIELVEEEHLKKSQILARDPFEYMSDQNDFNYDAANLNSSTTDDDDFWDDKELDAFNSTFAKEKNDHNSKVGKIQYNTVIRSMSFDPSSIGRYSRQSSSTSTVSSTYNDDIEQPTEPKQKTLKKRAKSVIFKFKSTNDSNKTNSLPGKLSNKNFFHKMKNKTRKQSAESELPIPTITQRIQLLRQNSSDDLLGEKNFRTSKRKEWYQRFRSQSTESVLNDVDLEKERKEKERKERRRRLAGYSFVNSDFNPNASVIKSREYSVDACAREVDRERHFLRIERKKAPRWSKRNMNVSTDKIEKVNNLKKVNIPDTFSKPSEISKTPNEIQNNVGKVKIPRAFSLEDILADNNNSHSREVLI